MFLRTAMTCAAVAALAACQPQATPDTPAAPAQTAEQAAPSPAPQAPVDEDTKPTETKPAPAGSVKLTSPLANAKVTSPVTIEGSADSSFFFEAVFPVELVADGKVIARGPAQAVTDWTAGGQVKFKAELEFIIAKETNAELVLSEDMPEPKSPDSDEAGPSRAVKIPLVLVPKS